MAKVEANSASSFPDVDVAWTFFDQLGQELIYTACVGLLERAFRCLGNDLTAFLTTLDGVNDVVQHQSGSEAEAEFVCIATPEAIELHFTTDHPSVAYLLVGSLKGIARQFYNDDAKVQILPDPYSNKFFRQVILQPLSNFSSLPPPPVFLFGSNSLFFICLAMRKVWVRFLLEGWSRNDYLFAPHSCNHRMFAKRENF